MNPRGEGAHPDGVLGPSRRSFLRAIIEPARAALVSDSRARGSALVMIGPPCIGCTVCAQLCPTGAIGRREDDDVVTLEVHDARCTACGVCVDACGPRAIHVERLIDPARYAVTNPRPLARVRLQSCAACGVSNPGPPGMRLCLVCARRAMSEDDGLWRVGP